ncbi:MAG: sigma-70 family RNA polymerase sigma factor [Pirellulaceae bacterium]|nr:sigma-70 family RNA polymerase sigma factor [Pirellulaceae bacterium]
MSVSDEVIQRAASGDRNAQREIYEQHGERVFRLVRRVVGESDADDVLQESFLRLFAKLDTFRGESEFTTWLHRLVVNEALQHKRRRARSTKTANARVDDQAETQDVASDLENTELLETAMSRIEPELRTIFELKEIDQLSYAEIAQTVGIPEGTVGSRLNRARTNLREQLTRLGWES